MEEITRQFKELEGTTKHLLFSGLVNEAFEKVKAELAYERDEMFTVNIGENKVSQIVEAEAVYLDVNLINNIAGGYVPDATVERFGNEQDGITYIPLEILTWRIAGGCNVELIQSVNKLKQDFNVHKLADFVKFANVTLRDTPVTQDESSKATCSKATESSIEVNESPSKNAGSFTILQNNVELPNGKIGDITEVRDSIDCTQLELLKGTKGVVCFNRTDYKVIVPGMLDVSLGKNLGNLKTYSVSDDILTHKNVFESHKVFQTGVVNGVVSLTYMSEIGNFYYLQIGKLHSIDIDDIIMFMHAISRDLSTSTKKLTLEQVQFVEIVNQVHAMLLRMPAKERGYSLEYYTSGQDRSLAECFDSDGYRKLYKHSVIVPLSQFNKTFSNMEINLRTQDGFLTYNNFINGQKKMLHAYQDDKWYVDMFGKYIYLTRNGDAIVETTTAYVSIDAAMELVLATLKIDIAIETAGGKVMTSKGQRVLSHNFKMEQIETKIYDALYNDIVQPVVNNSRVPLKLLDE